MLEWLSEVLQCNTWWCCATKMALILLVLIRIFFLYQRHKKIDRISEHMHNIMMMDIDSSL